MYKIIQIPAKYVCSDLYLDQYGWVDYTQTDSHGDIKIVFEFGSAWHHPEDRLAVRLYEGEREAYHQHSTQ